MFDLFLSEFKRYRKFALLLCALQTFLWIFIGKVTLIVQPQELKHLGLVFLALFGGATFAFISMGLHKRKNHWTYLIHRPLAAKKIHFAISLASICLLFIAVVLPFTGTIIFLDLFSNNVIEFRHYAFCLHLLAVTLCAYFLGSYAMLSPTKATFLSLWLLTYLTNSTPMALAVDLIVDLTFVVATFFLSRQAFRVNHQSEITSKTVIALSVVALQPIIVFVIILSLGIIYHVPLYMFGFHPSLDETRDTYRNFSNQELPEQFQQLLAQSQHPEAQALARQVTLAKFNQLNYPSFKPPYKQQLFLNEHRHRFGLESPEDQSFWVFSHELMVLIGRNLKTDEIIGYLGQHGFVDSVERLTSQDKFLYIPVAVAPTILQSKNTIYSVDFKNKKLSVKFILPTNEIFINEATFMFDRAIIQSNMATYFFDQIDFQHKSKRITAEHIIEHPVANIHYDVINITEVLNGFLINYQAYHLFGFEQPATTLTYAKHDGTIEQLAIKPFSEKHLPSWMRYRTLVLSPVVMNLIDGMLNPMIIYSNHAPKRYHFLWQRDLPMTVIIACVLLSLIAAIVTWWLTQFMSISKGTQRLWVLLSAITGIPGLLAFLLLTNGRQAIRNRQLILSALPHTSSKEQTNV